MTGRNILLVDDDPNLPRILTLRLRAAGYRVSVARAARQAVRAVGEESPDLIIIDVRISGGDGFAVHDPLNHLAAFRTPLIYLTGSAREAGEQTAQHLGAAAYVTRPFCCDHLLQDTERQIRKSTVPAHEN